MQKEITNSPKEIEAVVQSILGYIEDPANKLQLKGFEGFEDLGVDDTVRSIKVILDRNEYYLDIQHIVRENGDSLYVSSNDRNLIQYVFKSYTDIKASQVLLFHDGRINGIANLRNSDTINALKNSSIDIAVEESRILLGDFEMPLQKDDIEAFLSNIVKYAIFRAVFKDSYLSKELENNKNVAYWLYQPGEDARFWEEFYKESFIGLGWDYLGDLTQYKSKEEIANQLRILEKTTSSKKNDATANWDFFKEMKVGDIVIVKKGRRKLLGYGEVISDYIYDSNRSEYTSVREIKWIKKGEWSVSFDLVLKTLTNITQYNSDVVRDQKYYDYLLTIIEEEVDYKDLFRTWLRNKTTETSNRVGSYIRAIEILNEILITNLFKIRDIQYLQELYDDLIINQSHPNGKYYWEKAKSYGENKFYSSALREYKQFHIDFNKNIENSMDRKNFLNQILYGPPGTGKTYKLKKEYFDQFTVKEVSQTREQFLTELVSSFTWWQVITVVLLDLKRAKVLDIHNHELIQIKESLSASKTVRPTIWGQLQSHTILSCKNVNVVDRSEPLYFQKDSDSFWSIVEEDLKEKYPEAYDIYSQYKNHKASPNVEIKNYEFVTFHQSYSYEDFIEGIKPVLNDEYLGDIKFRVQDGVFKRLADKARRDPQNRYALFIDEINRGNVSAIFGELITLIEESKREGKPEALEVTLPYSKEKFSVPSNLYIIGTMNTADRSVEALDTALRRRFVFEEMLPNPDLEELDYEVYGYKASAILKRINLRIEKLVDRDHCIGHAYFIGKNEETIIDSFYKNIIPLLQEYFFGDYGKIGLVLGKGFIRLKKSESALFADFSYEYKEDLESRTVYEIIDYRNGKVDVEGFREAIVALMNNG